MHTREEVIAHRNQKDTFFKRSPQSPLDADAQRTFEGLTYFDYNPDLALNVTVNAHAEKAPVPIQTTTGEGRIYHRYGDFTFTVDGEAVKLTIYETPHGYFLPFVDADTETYPAGRYLDLQPNDDGTFDVDFNLAYNPFCVYSDAFSCPLTPPENHLTVPIRAGEKRYAPE